MSSLTSLPLLRRPLVVVLSVLALATTACGGSDADPGAAASPSASASSPASPSPSASTPSPTPSPTPSGPPTQLAPKVPGPSVPIRSIAPSDGDTVGVAMPISIVFDRAVAPAEHAAIERHLLVASSRPMVGAWHWFGVRRVDFRPTSFWTPGTRVRLDARLGSAATRRTFTVGADVRTHVYVAQHKTVVTKAGTVLRVMRSNAGSPALPTWTGTMAVVNKARTVRMDSCSVGLACRPGDPNYYDLELPWDVRITWSGTFLHYSSGDPNPGNGNGSHGCVHLSYADAQWYYELSKPGDPVVVTGSPRGKPDADNGYAGFNLTFKQWAAGSATGPFTLAPA